MSGSQSDLNLCLYEFLNMICLLKKNNNFNNHQACSVLCNSVSSGFSFFMLANISFLFVKNTVPFYCIFLFIGKKKIVISFFFSASDVGNSLLAIIARLM